MKTTNFMEGLAAYAAEYQPQLALLSDDMEPMPWIGRLAAWLDDCRSDPDAAIAEPALAEVLGLLVTLMHARMCFGLLEPARWGQPGKLIGIDDGGAVLAAAARADLMRLVARHDRGMAVRLAEATLRQIEDQRAAIATHIDARG